MNNTYNSKKYVACNKCGHEIQNVLEHVKYVLNGHCEHCADAPVHAAMTLKHTS